MRLALFSAPWASVGFMRCRSQVTACTSADNSRAMAASHHWCSRSACAPYGNEATVVVINNLRHRWGQGLRLLPDPACSIGDYAQADLLLEYQPGGLDLSQRCDRLLLRADLVPAQQLDDPVVRDQGEPDSLSFPRLARTGPPRPAGARNGGALTGAGQAPQDGEGSAWECPGATDEDVFSIHPGLISVPLHYWRRTMKWTSSVLTVAAVSGFAYTLAGRIPEALPPNRLEKLRQNRSRRC
jgi:hypothetical protein